MRQVLVVPECGATGRALSLARAMSVNEVVFDAAAHCEHINQWSRRSP
jgi:hypothetical protein